MRTDRRLWLVLAVVGVATAVWLGLTITLITSTLEPPQRELVFAQLGPRMGLLALTWLFGLGAIAWLMRRLMGRFVLAPARLLEQTKVLLAAELASPMQHKGTPETQALSDVIYQLASQRDALRQDMAAQVELASSRVAQEKSRLAALMAELTQSVVLCNLDGRIVLYNNRARLQFRALSQVPNLAAGAELMGIGRSIYAVFDRQLVAHALESLQQRMARGAANLSAQFVTTTRAGQLLKVQVAPVRHATAQAGSSDIAGFVLMLDNVTRSFEEEHLRDQLLHGLTEASRSSLANIQAAVDMLAYPDLEPPMRERFLALVREEVGRMGTRIHDLTQKTAEGIKSRWPLEEMLAADFLHAASRRMGVGTGGEIGVECSEDNLWLKVDSYSLSQVLAYLASRLVEELDAHGLRLSVQALGARAQLDLVWSGKPVSTETIMLWEMDPMRFGDQSTPLTVRDVVERHAGEMWFERDRVRQEARFRFLLPLANVQEAQDAQQLVQSDSRPEFYDFDLFQARHVDAALDDRRLSDLSYTVFDTETTGLNPTQGDQIIQIGAARIVNCRLLRQESFEQLVDPGRNIPAATVQIHGITQEMVKGKPGITKVLPAFHAYAQDTVLIAHNAAFDMKFLQLQERATGLAFDQPVLDTLLLSAVVHPNQESHRLEALAMRFNITVLGRHTALGDALVTAEVWLRLIPLLQEMGIHTLGQARAAARKTYFARLKY